MLLFCNYDFEFVHYATPCSVTADFEFVHYATHCSVTATLSLCNMLLIVL